MKIVYCIPSLTNPGGMERVLTTKVNYLADHYGYEVHIVTMQSKGDPFFTLSPRIICHNLNLINGNKHRKELEKLLFQIRPQVTVSMYGPEYPFLYKIKDGSKKVVEFHFSKYYLSHLVNGIPYLRFRTLHKIKAWLLQKKEERYASRYDKVVLLTQQDMGLWGNKPNMHYIHNPVSFRSEQVSTLENKQIIAMGRYIAQKGFDLLIDAFNLIAKEFPEWKLNIYGEGQDQTLLKQKIKELRLEKQVSLYPPTKQVKEKFIESSIFVFPSRYEGFGLVLTEAMECGLPCIAFDCECGPREIIEPSITGYIVENKNKIVFANKMKELMSNPERRKKMGMAGKERAVKFYIEPIMKQWHQLFSELTK